MQFKKYRRTRNYRSKPFNNFRVKAFNPSSLVGDWDQHFQNNEPIFSPVNNFFDLDINPMVKKNLQNRGYNQPTQIQDRVIPLLLQGKDVVGIASTGTGKTAAFLIPFINKMFNNRDQKMLVIVPTRELALQIDAEFRSLSRGSQLQSVVCIGGVGMVPQIRQLSGNHHLVVGTPGRLMDLEQRRKIKFSDYSNNILDEVDRMLDMGFIHDVKKIVKSLPANRQSACFSATLPDNVRHLMGQFLSNPELVVIDSPIGLNVDQKIIKTNGKAKLEVLHDLLIQDGFNKVLVFGRTKRGLDSLAGDLNKRGFKLATIHGNKRQSQRQMSLEKFRRSQVKILLATDVASRGLDIQGVTHVINFDLPETKDDYIHRIGRTGRANNKGVAVTFID